MNLFKSIDDKLHEFAKRKNGEVRSKGTTMAGIPPEKIQERMIIWAEGTFLKGIFITPIFTTADIDSPLWDFNNYASVEDGKVYPEGGPFWLKYLLQEVEFAEIEKSIDQLLMESEKNLAAVKLEDMRISWSEGYEIQD
jgi:hypothetical protein